MCVCGRKMQGEFFFFFSNCVCHRLSRGWGGGGGEGMDMTIMSKKWWISVRRDRSVGEGDLDPVGFS